MQDLVRTDGKKQKSAILYWDAFSGHRNLILETSDTPFLFPAFII